MDWPNDLAYVKHDFTAKLLPDHNIYFDSDNI